jgi:hypothetical protein
MIGHGGMATVYEARRDRDGLRVALKLLAPHLAADPEFRERFIREARAASSLEHPHAIPVIDSGIDPDAGGFLVMELVDGPNLHQRIREAGRLPVAEVLRMVEQVAGALDEAHRLGLVHRDVKPANILLDRSGAAYLGDFGVARDLAATRLTTTGAWLGTLDYAAPEQIEGGVVDARADVYALAAVAFHALSGSVPFPRADPMATMWAHVHEPRPSLPANLFEHADQVGTEIARGMAIDPDDRHPSAGHLAKSLAAAREGATARIPRRHLAAAHPGSPSEAGTMKLSEAETVKLTRAGRSGPFRRWGEGGLPRLRWLLALLGVLAVGMVAGGFAIDSLRGDGEAGSPAQAETPEAPGAPAASTEGVDGDTGTAEADTAPPDVVGNRLDLATSALEEAGYEPQVKGGGLFGVIVERNWVVCFQQLLDETTVELGVDRSC